MTQIFDDDNGNKSSMRVMCFLSLLAAIVFGWLVVTGDNDGAMIVYAFLLGAFCPKALQKYIEVLSAKG